MNIEIKCPRCGFEMGEKDTDEIITDVIESYIERCPNCSFSFTFKVKGSFEGTKVEYDY